MSWKRPSFGAYGIITTIICVYNKFRTQTCVQTVFYTYRGVPSNWRLDWRHTPIYMYRSRSRSRSDPRDIARARTNLIMIITNSNTSHANNDNNSNK